jgi:hypothetical protein
MFIYILVYMHIFIYISMLGGGSRIGYGGSTTVGPMGSKQVRVDVSVLTART